MNKLLLTFAVLLAMSGSLLAQNPGAKEAAEEDSSIGLDFSINYYSKYIWRGIDFYEGDGYFYPAIAWEIFGTGLTLSVGAEISQSWVFNGFTPRQKKYYLDWDGSIYKKQKQVVNYAYANHGLDVGLDYSYTFQRSGEDVFTIGAGFWHYWYYNSKNANEMAWPVVESLKKVKKWDTSYFSANISMGLDFVPWINPSLAVFYDNYYGYERSGDYYVQLGFSHEFALVPDVVTITPAVTAGYYYGRTFGYNNWYLADPNGTIGDLSDDIIWRDHVAVKKGISDIVPSVTLSVTKDGWYFTSGFFWVIVPTKSWYKGGPVHRYYAQVGMGYAI